jgi:hypothetical protein
VSSHDLQQGADVLLQLLRENWPQHDLRKILHNKFKQARKFQILKARNIGKSSQKLNHTKLGAVFKQNGKLNFNISLGQIVYLQ